MSMKIKRNCDECGSEYFAKKADLNRGWGKCCSKACAAKKREKSKPGYNIEKVLINNEKRKKPRVIDSNLYGDFTGKYTSEGYRIYGTTAINKWGEPEYDTSNFYN